MVEVVSATRHLLRAFAWLALPGAVLAHVLDEYLQATLLDIEPGEVRLQINLTPGVAVADQVLAQVDRDHNGTISTKEAAAYAESLKRDLTLRLDKHVLDLKLTASEFPAPAELRTGWGIIQLQFSAKRGRLDSGPHKLTLENRHLNDLSVFLVNATQPRSAAIRIDGQKRNDNQSEAEIKFTFSPVAQSRGTESANVSH